MPYDVIIETAAECGIDESIIWTMTPAEFNRRVNYVLQVRNYRREQALQRENREMWRTAWLVSTIMNFAGKQLKGQSVNPDDLIAQPQTKEQALEKRAAIVRRHRLDERFGIYPEPYSS